MSNYIESVQKSYANHLGGYDLHILAQILPFILLITLLYFFIIRPQNKQQKMLTDMINNLNVGNKVITRGGIIGKVNQILDNTFIIELYDGNKVEILKDAVIAMLNGEK